MKFRNYKNKHTNNNVIHSYENLMGMTFDEITDRANELGTQYKQIGLPTNSELNSSPNAVYVHAYTRDDGTQVRAHWRGVNGGNNSIAGQIQNGVSIPNYNDGIFGDLNNNASIPNYKDGIEGNGTNNIDIQTTLAPLLLPMILSQIPIPNLQTQQNTVKGNYVDNTSNFDEYNPQLYGQVETTDIEDNLFRKPIEPIKNLIDNILNNKTDYDVPKTIWERIQEKIYTDLLKSKFPMASEATENGINNLSAAKRNPNATVYTSLNNLKDKYLQQALKEYGAKNNMPGVYYNNNSIFANKISNSDEIKEYIDNICNNGETIANKTLNFGLSIKKPIDSFDRYSSIQHAKIHNPHISEDGNYFEGTVVDISDFEKRKATLFNIPNNWGYNMQEKGQYKNYFEVVDIKVPLTEEQKERLRKHKKNN